jgi:3-hydroxyacyl-CoA dehydrogenase
MSTTTLEPKMEKTATNSHTPNTMIKNVTVIGAGTMGNGISHVFAQHGYNVSMMDVSADALQRALNTIAKNLDRQLAKQLISEEDKQKHLAR